MLVEKRGVTWGQYSCSVILTTVYIAQDYKLSGLCKYCSELWGMWLPCSVIALYRDNLTNLHQHV